MAKLIYVATPPKVVIAMIEMANIQPTDIVVDLGCGDGRLGVAALLAGAARVIAVEHDEYWLAEADRVGRCAGVRGRMELIKADLRDCPLDRADVVLGAWCPPYMPGIAAQLGVCRPGVRVVSNRFRFAHIMADEWDEVVVGNVNHDIWGYETPLKIDHRQQCR